MATHSEDPDLENNIDNLPLLDKEFNSTKMGAIKSVVPDGRSSVQRNFGPRANIQISNNPLLSR